MNELAALKVPPHSIEAEQAVIGGVFINKDAINEISFLRAEDFYKNAHRIIFTAILDLTAKNEPCDIITVAELLERRHQIDDAGGMRTLGSIAENTPSASNIKAYAQIVSNRASLRYLLSATQSINEVVFTPEGKNTEEILDFASTKIFNLTEEKLESNIKSAREITAEWLEKLDRRYQNPGQIQGLKTGFSDLDDRLNGLDGGDLVIVAARPSMGKTCFAMNIAEHQAVVEKKSVVIFSLEMPNDQLIQRSVSSISGIEYTKLKTGLMEDSDWPKATDAVAKLSQANIHIDDTGGLTAMQMRAAAFKIKRKHGLDLIVIDYLQLMNHPKQDRHDLAIAETTKALKSIAKELKIPIILLSRLNRSLEQRTDKRPNMSDLRDSGAIEQDADIIIFLYREEVYVENSGRKGVADILVRKQRNGATGDESLVFLGKNMKFLNHIKEASTPEGRY